MHIFIPFIKLNRSYSFRPYAGQTICIWHSLHLIFRKHPISLTATVYFIHIAASFLDVPPAFQGVPKTTSFLRKCFLNFYMHTIHYK